MGFVVSSHFKGKKTETQTSELGQGQQPIKIEELRFKLILLTVWEGEGCIMPFQVIIQVIVAPEFGACASQSRELLADSFVRCLLVRTLEQTIKQHSGQRALW